MTRNILSITLLALSLCSIWACSSTEPKNQQSLVFTTPGSEKRASYLQDQLIQNPSDVEKHIELGRIFLTEVDMVDEAIVELETALLIKPNNTVAILLLSLAFQRQMKPDFQKAALLLEKASQIERQNATVHLHLAHIYCKQENYNKAIREFQQALDSSDDPTTIVSAHIGLMSVYEQKGESQKARDHFKAACGIYPDVADMIRHAEINSITPPPKYSGTESEGSPTHPSYDKRIIQAVEEIRKLKER